MSRLDGSVESIVFRNEDNHYTVARFRPNDSGRLFRDDLTTIVGTLPGVHVGELLVVEGEWEKDPKYGRQLHVISFTQRLPASIEGITRYLGSGLINGIGFRTADEIAVKLGLPRDGIHRISTGLIYVLAQAANDDGHCFLLENEL